MVPIILIKLQLLLCVSLLAGLLSSMLSMVVTFKLLSIWFTNAKLQRYVTGSLEIDNDCLVDAFICDMRLKRIVCVVYFVFLSF